MVITVLNSTRKIKSSLFIFRPKHCRHTLDFVVSMKSPYKFRKLTSFVSFIINVTRLASSFRKVKEDYNFNKKLIKRSKVSF